MTETIGICKFCGQIRSYAEELELSEEELNENATRSCSCSEAKAYVQKISDAEFFNKRREEEILRGTFRISELFGEGAGQYDMEPVTADIINVLETMLILAIDDGIKSVSLNISAKTKASITKSTKDKVSITRTDNATFKKEV